MKPERIQGQLLPIDPERLREERDEMVHWEVDKTPNAIYRHFPQPSFAASVAFLEKVVPASQKHGRAPFFYGDATGVTVRLGNAPRTGVTEADLDLAADLNDLV